MNKTPDEIKKGLECCHRYGSCDGCPYVLTLKCGFGDELGCDDSLLPDALAYIQQLESANAELLTKVDQLTAKCHQLERERDAAVVDIHKTCSTCKHYYYNRQDDDTAGCLWFDGCKSEDHWEWRGVKEE